MCLRLREQCLRSEITSVARVAHFLLLRFVAGNMDVNTPASKRSDLIRKRSDCSNAPRNPQVDLCVFASFSCRVYAETQGRDVRPVAGLTHSIGVFFVFPFLDDNKLRRRVHTMPEVPYTNVWCSGKTMHIAKIIQYVLLLIQNATPFLKIKQLIL